jgi:hypothetical protein
MNPLCMNIHPATGEGMTILPRNSGASRGTNVRKEQLAGADARTGSGDFHPTKRAVFPDKGRVRAPRLAASIGVITLEP